MTTSDFAYTGCDNLEAMAEAVNYNTFLVDTVDRHLAPAGAASDVRVLDFGAGSGTYADMLAARQITPECLEPDEELQHILRAKGYKVLDHDGTPEHDGERYGLIYTFNVLEHIKNDQTASEHLAALLRPGGTLVVYVPALEILYTAMDSKVGHYRRYRRTQLNRILRNAGLEIVESRYCDPLGFFATLAYKMLGPGDGTINPRSLKLYDRAVFPISKALQILTSRFFGKNVLVVATKA
ncbi:class I SAM-dependent methyltransferase [Nocardia sp. CA2R105]|uniref:class I SAM-dependent methyltransferase n=1 Tax=Nocardia coffeae TaxID=2873381 RepID=UPI001CA6B052|nr:class I SAM-dependent methyltransferase [Nocardia coffeae]MBY8863251.1 class I SAM-dependent methyltransferase [Nocardia coffeae]